MMSAAHLTRNQSETSFLSIFRNLNPLHASFFQSPSALRDAGGRWCLHTAGLKTIYERQNVMILPTVLVVQRTAHRVAQVQCHLLLLQGNFDMSSPFRKKTEEERELAQALSTCTFSHFKVSCWLSVHVSYRDPYRRSS